MASSAFSPVERAALAEICNANASSGFPGPDAVSFESRELTPCGRYVMIVSPVFESLEDGYYDMGDRYIEIEGVPNGAMAVTRVEGGRVVELELTTYGGASWNGSEDAFSVVEKTGI